MNSKTKNLIIAILLIGAGQSIMLNSLMDTWIGMGCWMFGWVVTVFGGVFLGRMFTDR